MSVLPSANCKPIICIVRGKRASEMTEMSALLPLLFTLLLYLTPKSVSQQLLPDEQKLLNNLGLFDAEIYDKSVRPVFNASKNVVVDFGFTLIQIVDMDEKNQVLVTNAWLVHKWIDDRISWNTSDYGGLYNLRVPAHVLWLPDIVLYNNADDYTAGFMPINAMVYNDGTIFWSPPSKLRSSCKVDITYFPFDKQSCPLKFGSWTYDKAQVDITATNGTVDVVGYTSNGEWLLTGHSIRRHEIQYPISSEIYPDVTVVIVMQRRILYYVLNIIFPCFWLNILSCLTFWLPSDAGEKITLNITVLLSYSVFMLVVAESMPQTSEFVPLIGIYLTISMSTSSLCVFVTVFILKLHHPGPRPHRVPRWIRIVFLGFLSSLVKCKCSRERKRSKDGEDFMLSESFSNQELGETSSIFINNHGSLQTERNKKYTENRPKRRVVVNGPETSPQERRDSCSNIDELLCQLGYMVAQTNKTEVELETIEDWKEVAHVADRVAFLIFLLITLFSASVVLIAIPYFVYDKHEGL